MDRSFTLRGHIAKVLAVASLILCGGLWLAHDAPAWMWATWPVFWVVANVFEWAIHRFAMHRPLRPRVLYQAHALIHHRAFVGDAQQIRQVAELSLVMMPWYTLVLVFVMASPIAGIAAALAGPALAGVFFIASVSYFLLYEAIHTLHHLTATQLASIPLGRSRMVAALRAHHLHHHQRGTMVRVNFNVTFPLADRIMGTYEHAGT
jgi:Fatty acid hydroxylase superfamily